RYHQVSSSLSLFSFSSNALWHFGTTPGSERVDGGNRAHKSKKSNRDIGQDDGQGWIAARHQKIADSLERTGHVLHLDTKHIWDEVEGRANTQQDRDQTEITQI